MAPRPREDAEADERRDAFRFTGSVVQGFRNWVGVWVPPNVTRRLGTKAQVAVAGHVNGIPFHGSFVPTGRGHFMWVNRAFRRANQIEPGQPVVVVVVPDAARAGGRAEARPGGEEVVGRSFRVEASDCDDVDWSGQERGSSGLPGVGRAPACPACLPEGRSLLSDQRGSAASEPAEASDNHQALTAITWRYSTGITSGPWREPLCPHLVTAASNRPPYSGEGVRTA